MLKTIKYGMTQCLGVNWLCKLYLNKPGKKINKFITSRLFIGWSDLFFKQYFRTSKHCVNHLEYRITEEWYLSCMG